MAKLLIPSRNRPTSLGYILTFISRFYPGQDIIIADGSTVEYKDHYKYLCKCSDFNNINIEYRQFDPSITVANRIVSVLESINDDLIIMGADDDYPLLDTLKIGEGFLKKHRDYSTAMGSTINLYLYKDGSMKARLGVSRPLNSNSLEKRVMDFAEWPFSTTYAITRRDLLLERYKRAAKYFLANFYDYSAGILDCMSGKIKALRDISFISTRNYKHSYFRPDDDLIYLRRGNEVLKYIDIFQEDFLKFTNIPNSRAQELAKTLIRMRIEQLAGCRAHRRPGFSKSSLFKNTHIQYQYKKFHGLFTKNDPERKRLYKKIKYIADALNAIPDSNDNQGENKTYETFEEQVQ